MINSIASLYFGCKNGRYVYKGKVDLPLEKLTFFSGKERLGGF